MLENNVRQSSQNLKNELDTRNQARFLISKNMLVAVSAYRISLNFIVVRSYTVLQDHRKYFLVIRRMIGIS